MFGVPLYQSKNILYDDKSVVTKSSKVEYTLKKKHSSVIYHEVCRDFEDGSVITLGINKNFNSLYEMENY